MIRKANVINPTIFSGRMNVASAYAGVKQGLPPGQNVLISLNVIPVDAYLPNYNH